MDDRRREIEETFARVGRPLARPIQKFRRRRVTTARFVGYRFTQSRGTSVLGIAIGFMLGEGVLPGPVDPPEAVAYVFVRPVPSALHRSTVLRPRSPVRRLVEGSESLGIPYAFDPASEICAIRRRPMRAVPPEIFPFVASDFFLHSVRPLWSSGLLGTIRRPRPRTRR